MTDRELMQQALEALENAEDQLPKPYSTDAREAITALRERLAQPVQEPVAWVTGWHDGHCVIRAVDPSVILPICTAFYTTPQPRTWVGLTDEEKSELDAEYGDDTLAHLDAIEAKLREKNT